MASSTDAEIYEYAALKEYIIVTKDEDFFYLARSKPDVGLLWIRLGNCRTVVLLAALDQQWSEIIRCFEAGDGIVEIR